MCGVLITSFRGLPAEVVDQLQFTCNRH
jgi:hypothetical protein